jgi:hypothetical protein
MTIGTLRQVLRSDAPFTDEIPKGCNVILFLKVRKILRTTINYLITLDLQGESVIKFYLHDYVHLHALSREWR